MKIITAVAITACITFVSTLVLATCIETTIRHNRLQARLNGLGGIVYVGDGIYEMVRDQESYFLYSRYADQLILGNGYGFFVEDETFCFCSNDGYAIIYPENNMCKVYIASQNSNDPVKKLISSEEYNLNKLIVYLDSFDEFTDYEKKLLLSMSENPVR